MSSAATAAVTRPDAAVVVLAAGLGTRFRSSQAKVMHRAVGRTLLRHVLEAVRPVGAKQVIVVVGHQADLVAAEAQAADIGGLVTVEQAEQRGTGHAVEQALIALEPGIRRVLVVPGDCPLVTTSTLAMVLDADDQAPAVLLSTELDDPTGYGRLIRDGVRVVEVVEERDASSAQRALREVNAGVYAFDRVTLTEAVAALDEDNAQGERYLTDVVAVMTKAGHTVRAVAVDPIEVRGVNDRVQLAEAAARLRERVLVSLMRAGVTVVDPAATYVDADVVIGPDTTVLPGCVIEGATRVGSRVTLGPHTRLVDAEVEDGATVAQSVVLGASIGPDANVGPFSYLRPGTRMERDTKAGAFVEMKNTHLGDGSKVPHLSYVGDATIGRDVNVGAGSITCNYDGFDKHQTVIEDGANIGSDTMLVAPVTVGRGAVTGAATTVRDDVPAGALAVNDTGQRVVEGWADERRLRRTSDGDAEGTR